MFYVCFCKKLCTSYVEELRGLRSLTLFDNIRRSQNRSSFKSLGKTRLLTVTLASVCTHLGRHFRAECIQLKEDHARTERHAV